MNINYKQPQFELFPANSATLGDIDKPKFLLANLTLSVESLVIFSILGIMVALFSFSLGVERGKHVAAQTMDEKVAEAWNVGARTVAPSVAPAPVLRAPVAARPVGNMGLLLSAGSRRIAPAHVNTPSGVGGHFTLQLATYGSQEYARQDALILKAKKFQSFLIKSGKYWLVCVGNFTSKEGATAFLRKLPEPYRSSQVRRF